MFIQLDGVEELIMFVAIIRNEDIDSDKIKKLTKDLNKSTDKLEDAVESQSEVKS